MLISPITAIFLSNYLFVSIHAYSFNAYLDRVDPLKKVQRYPSSCCQLEWRDININDPLPNDYVLAGTRNGINYAYVGGKSGYLGLKSILLGLEPNWLYMLAVHPLRKIPIQWNKVYPYPILVNPNKCIIKWHTVTSRPWTLPNISDAFFPRVTSSKYGDFARTNGAGAKVARDGYVRFVTSDTESGWNNNLPQLMYVKCNSVPKTPEKIVDPISNFHIELYNISIDPHYIEILKKVPTKVIYVKKMLINNSPEASKSKIKFQIETFDNASIQLSDSLFSYLKTDDKTYKKWSIGGKLSGLFAILGVNWEIGGEKKNEHWLDTSSGFNISSGQEIFRTSARRELFEFSQKIKIPAFSKTTITAFSKPVRGEIPITVIYAVTSMDKETPQTVRKLLLEKGMKQKMVATNQGQLLLYYDGTMNLDVGHEVDVDIQTHKLDGASSATIV